MSPSLKQRLSSPSSERIESRSRPHIPLTGRRKGVSSELDIELNLFRRAKDLCVGSDDEFHFVLDSPAQVDDQAGVARVLDQRARDILSVQELAGHHFSSTTTTCALPPAAGMVLVGIAHR